jgi:hypothetical protein
VVWASTGPKPDSQNDGVGPDHTDFARRNRVNEATRIAYASGVSLTAQARRRRPVRKIDTDLTQSFFVWES